MNSQIAMKLTMENQSVEYQAMEYQAMEYQAMEYQTMDMQIVREQMENEKVSIDQNIEQQMSNQMLNKAQTTEQNAMDTKMSIEDLMIKIGELIAMEIDEVEEVKYSDKEMGCTAMIILKGGTEIVFSLL